jgi:hypothetical protein
VGGRSEALNLSIIDTFELDMIGVFYERDTTSIDGIDWAMAHLPSQTKVLAYSLNGDVRRFYIFNDRYRSSILPLVSI